METLGTLQGNGPIKSAQEAKAASASYYGEQCSTPPVHNASLTLDLLGCALTELRRNNYSREYGEAINKVEEAIMWIQRR